MSKKTAARTGTVSVTVRVTVCTGKKAQQRGPKETRYIPVRERRCICDFCLELAVLLDFGADLALVDWATAMLVEVAGLMRPSRWLGGSVDICTLPPFDGQLWVD